MHMTTETNPGNAGGFVVVITQYGQPDRYHSSRGLKALVDAACVQGISEAYVFTSWPKACGVLAWLKGLPLDKLAAYLGVEKVPEKLSGRITGVNPACTEYKEFGNVWELGTKGRLPTPHRAILTEDLNEVDRNEPVDLNNLPPLFTVVDKRTYVRNDPALKTPTSWVDYALDKAKMLDTQREQTKFLVCFPGTFTALTSPEFSTRYGTITDEFIVKMQLVQRDKLTVVYTTFGDVSTILHEKGMPFTVIYPTRELFIEWLQRYKANNSLVDEGMLAVNWEKLQQFFRRSNNCKHIELHDASITLDDLKSWGIL
jgi:hypothetical protein